MPDAVKPEICLTGKLLYQVHIGLPAYIQGMPKDFRSLCYSGRHTRSYRD